ncbi:hypothetical protein GX50_02064 [[Emmonsia] crescens]|uniref:HNH nuclease domain-containing protein n=1 Tax=[Emmonsia] crescens TaxID=73230 RepID=A0A2B7ZQ53_9EURO|nr:hypothetical protein GX50_02064 [Emmonsia crescens]
MDKKVADDKMGPGVELRDPARVKLLEELQNIFGPVSQKAQASLLLCDLEHLQHLSESSINYVVVDYLQRGLSDQTVDDIVKKWCQRSRSPSTASPAQSISVARGQPKPSPLRRLAVANTETQAPEEQEETDILPPPPKRRRYASPSSSGESRSRYISDECKNRDSYRCVVTKLAGPLDAAHIVPFFLNKKDERASFFNLLKSLFAQRIEKWKSLLDNGTEFVENMLSLTPTLHRFHSAGLFGLQPIEASLDGKSLKLKFYWLAQRETTSDTMTNLMDIPTFPDDVELEDIKICNAKDGHIIKSGEVIELTTSDPEQHPLPNWDLLELQWIMQRLTALKGAADIPDSVLTESEDSGEIFDEELGEWRERNIDEEAIEKAQSSRIDNWIGTQQIQA